MRIADCPLGYAMPPEDTAGMPARTNCSKRPTVTGNLSIQKPSVLTPVCGGEALRASRSPIMSSPSGIAATPHPAIDPSMQLRCGWRTHSAPPHDSPSPHERPQRPQLERFVTRSTQVPAQTVKPPSHAMWAIASSSGPSLVNATSEDPPLSSRTSTAGASIATASNIDITSASTTLESGKASVTSGRHPNNTSAENIPAIGALIQR